MSNAPGGTRPRGGNGARWVTLGRACEILGVDESTLRRWADSGRLRVYRTPGGHRRFALGNLEELVGAGTNDQRVQIGHIAFTKIRSELRRARQQEGGWYASLSDDDRLKLRELGRRLVEMVSEFMVRRRWSPGQLDEARDIGREYGRILKQVGLPLPDAVEAYIGFRMQMDETTRQASTRESLPTEEALDAYSQVHRLGDQVLLAIAAAYQGEAVLAAPGVR